jgi:RNA polymerase sigma factor (sigma-70 family)
MEVSALTYQGGGIPLHGRSPLLRLQSDERLIAAIRRGNASAFEVLVARYQSRLLSFCRHMLGSREDAEDVLQEVMAAAFNAIVADERPINVRPWLYRIARNRSLNHLRKASAIGVDSMDHHLADHGSTTADKVHEREEFRTLVGDIQELPETQRTALVLREMDALSYEQIAEAMETTISSVKSLLVRARVSLAEAAEARLLSCEEVRMELAEVAEGLHKRPSPLVRRHLKDCKRCAEFRGQLKATNKALAALLPVGPLVVIRRLAFLHFGHGAAGAGAGASSAGGTATATATAGAAAAAAGGGAFGGGSIVTAGLGAVATKAAAGLAAAAVVTAGAVAVDHHHKTAKPIPTPVASAPERASTAAIAPSQSYIEKPSTVAAQPKHVTAAAHTATTQTATTQTTSTTQTTPTTQTAQTTTAVTTGSTVPVAATTTAATTPTTTTAATTTTPAPGRVQTQTDPTVLPPTTTDPAPPLGVPVATTPTTTVPATASTTPVATTPAPTTPPAATTPTTPVVSTPTAPATTPAPPATTSVPTTTPPTTPTTPTTSSVPGGLPATTASPIP